MSRIEVRDLWKQYRRPHQRVNTLKEALVAFFRGQTGYEEFWALRSVSFTVNPGEVVGVVGPNGSGKSTLLAILARVLVATRGSVQVEGRVCPMLELGTGFHPDLTGRENVFMNASLLGLSRKQTAQQYDAIVDFAELSEFMDAPVKTYSSGMVVRLGFSVAVHLDPDVLLIDEVLGVGDEHFQHKSFERLRQFKQVGEDDPGGVARTQLDQEVLRAGDLAGPWAHDDGWRERRRGGEVSDVGGRSGARGGASEGSLCPSCLS